MAHALQVETSQAVNIGQTKMETIGYAHTHSVDDHMIINVGDAMRINVGSTFQIIVGDNAPMLTMDGQGNVIITGTKFTTVFSDAVKHWGKIIDLNPLR